MPLVVSHRSGRVKTSIRQVSGDDLSHHVGSEQALAPVRYPKVRAKHGKLP